MYVDLNKTVFMRMPPGYGKQDKVFKLNRALYGFCRSFFLWLQKLTNKMKKLGFKKIS